MSTQREQIEAENYLLKLISFRTRSENEARFKLKKKGYEEEIINKVIEKAKELNLINDKEFVAKFIHDKLKLSKKSKLRIKNELYYKFGVDEKIINEEINKVSEEVEKEVVKDLIKRKRKEKKEKDKIISYLIRCGFDKDMIEEVLTEYIIPNET